MDMGLVEENVSAVKAVRLQQSFDHRHWPLLAKAKAMLSIGSLGSSRRMVTT
jgi:hypothetical protein